jgi:hypothetical protein
LGRFFGGGVVAQRIMMMGYVRHLHWQEVKVES